MSRNVLVIELKHIADILVMFTELSIHKKGVSLLSSKPQFGHVWYNTYLEDNNK